MMGVVSVAQPLDYVIIQNEGACGGHKVPGNFAQWKSEFSVDTRRRSVQQTLGRPVVPYPVVHCLRYRQHLYVTGDVIHLRRTCHFREVNITERVRDNNIWVIR